MVPPRSGPPKRPLARTVASTPLSRYPSPDTGSQDPKDVSRDTARDLSALAGELAALKGDAAHGLESPEYAALKHSLESAHAAIEGTLIEARRRVRTNEGRER